MSRFATALAIAAAPFLTAGAAHAQNPATGGSATPAPQPGVTVRAPERMVCRNVTRTATRMRTSRVCQPVSQLNAEAGRSQDEVLADAADTLEMYGEKVSTNCVGGFFSGHETPLGPR